MGAAAVSVSLAGAVATPKLAGADGPYDFAAIEARLALPFRHRQAFGTKRIADGTISAIMLNSLNAYQFDYGDGPASLHAAGIFYGTSVAMVLDDEVWRTYKIALVQQRRGDPPTGGRPGDGNPYLAARSTLDPAAPRTDLHGFYHDASLVALAKRQASFFACDNALTGLATDIAVNYGTSDLPAQSVLANLRKHLIGNTLLVPAGVAAVNQAQEMKFTFMPAAV